MPKVFLNNRHRLCSKWTINSVFVLNANVPPVSEQNMQHSPEQSSLLSSSLVWANGSSGPAASLDAQNTDPLSALDAFRDRERENKKKNQRPTRGGVVEIALCLHLFLQYLFTFRAVSLQQGNYFISTWNKSAKVKIKDKAKVCHRVCRNKIFKCLFMRRDSMAVQYEWQEQNKQTHRDQTQQNRRGHVSAKGTL